MAAEPPIGRLGSGDEEGTEPQEPPLLLIALLVGAGLGVLLSLRQIPGPGRYHTAIPYSVAAVQILIGMKAAIAVIFLFFRETRPAGAFLFVLVCAWTLTYYLLVTLMSSLWPGLVDSWS